MPAILSNQDQENIQKIKSLAADSRNVLCVVKSVFPFQLFPSILTIEKTKIVYTQNSLFGNYSETIVITNIASVTLQSSFFFSSIAITNKAASAPVLTITHLSTPQAREAVQIIRGLIVSYQTNADLSAVPSSVIVDPLKQIGTTQV